MNWLPFTPTLNAAGDNCGTGKGGFQRGNRCAGGRRSVGTEEALVRSLINDPNDNVAYAALTDHYKETDQEYKIPAIAGLSQQLSRPPVRTGGIIIANSAEVEEPLPNGRVRVHSISYRQGLRNQPEGWRVYTMEGRRQDERYRLSGLDHVSDVRMDLPKGATPQAAALTFVHKYWQPNMTLLSQI